MKSTIELMDKKDVEKLANLSILALNLFNNAVKTLSDKDKNDEKKVIADVINGAKDLINDIGRFYK